MKKKNYIGLCVLPVVIAGMLLSACSSNVGELNVTVDDDLLADVADEAKDLADQAGESKAEESKETDEKAEEGKEADEKDSEDAEKKDGSDELPLGTDKTIPVMQAIGYRILETGDYDIDSQWRTIGIAVGIGYGNDFGRGKYEMTEDKNGIIVPSDDVRDFFSLLTPGFDGELPELTESYLVSYDKKNDAYIFGLGDFAMDIPACDGFRKCEEGYEALCGTKYYDSETLDTKDHDNHGIVTLVHNDYSDKEDNPMFIWQVSKVEVIGKDEYEKILPEFSRDSLMPEAEAYAKFLNDYKTDEYTGENGVCFRLGYVDEDDIPELFISLDNAHNATIKVFGYRDGEVKEIGEFGSLGEGRYIPYKNILLDRYWGSGADYTNFLKIENDSLKSFGYVETEPEDITNYDPDHLVYMIAEDNVSDTKTVSKEEYEEAYEKFAGGNSAAAIEVSYSNSWLVQKDYDDTLELVKSMLYIH